MEAAPTERETAVTQTAEEGEGKERPTLDPLELALTLPVFSVQASPVETAVRGGPWLDPVVCEIVQSLAWGGDRRRGAARIELAGKRFGGASVIVHAEGGAVTLELAAPAHVNVSELGERLRERLEKRGLTVRIVGH